LHDVAAKAGVAVTTVARVVNEKGYVADATRKKVLAAIEVTGYRVNSLARTLKSSRSKILGHLLASTVPNPFFVKVARGVEAHALSRGYNTLTYNVQTQAEAERRGIDTFLGWRADALIFSTPVSSANVEYAIKNQVPVVQVERPRSDLAHQITVRNYDAALMAMKHLTELGHRSIAYIGPAPGGLKNELADYVESERVDAYRDAMKNISSLAPDLIFFGDAYELDVTTAQGHGYRATQELLARPNRPTAIMAGNDILAAGAYQAIHEAHLRVPDDISVVGFDDTLAEFLTPLLSTVRLPARRLGEAAARIAIDQIESGQTRNPERIQLDAEFIPRKSTAAPATR
jgi:LacI family transcriptional regulator